MTFAGCTSSRVTNNNKHSVELGAGLIFDLLQPASYGQSLSLTQVAEISSEQGQHELIFVLQIQANEMIVIGLLPNGTRVFSITYDGKQLKSEGYDQLIEKVDPKYLIADIQISLWPIRTLRQQWLSNQACYDNGECRIFEKASEVNDSNQRMIMVGDQKLVSVSFSSVIGGADTIVLKHLERGYQISLESTE